MRPRALSIDEAIALYTERRARLTQIGCTFRSSLNAAGVHLLNRVIRETEDAVDTLHRARGSEVL